MCREASGLEAWLLPPDDRPEGGEFETRPRLQTAPLWSRCQEGPLLSVQVGPLEVSKEIIILSEKFQ